MNFPDLYIDRDPTDAALSQAVATVFGVPFARVAVFGAYDELLREIGDEVDVLVERVAARGDFATRIGLYPQPSVVPVSGDRIVPILAELCRLLHAHGIAPDDASDDPTAFLVLGAGRLPARVQLDAERLDRGELVLAHATAAPGD